MKLLFRCFILLIPIVFTVNGLPIPLQNSAPYPGLLPLRYNFHRPRAQFPVRAVPSRTSTIVDDTFITTGPIQYHGWKLVLVMFLSLLLLVVLGVVGGLTIGVSSVDLPRLLVWSRCGDEKRRKHARRILALRNRPHWLIVSLVFASVGLAEALPIFVNHIFPPNSWIAYFGCTFAVATFGTIIPQTLVQVYLLELAGRLVWLIRLIMFFMMIPSAPFAYALRRIQRYRKRHSPDKVDGIMTLIEVAQFIEIHAKGTGYGGEIEDSVADAAKALIQQQMDMGTALENEKVIQTTALDTGPMEYPRPNRRRLYKSVQLKKKPARMVIDHYSIV